MTGDQQSELNEKLLDAITKLEEIKSKTPERLIRSFLLKNFYKHTGMYQSQNIYSHVLVSEIGENLFLLSILIECPNEFDLTPEQLEGSILHSELFSKLRGVNFFSPRVATLEDALMSFDVDKYMEMMRAGLSPCQEVIAETLCLVGRQWVIDFNYSDSLGFPRSTHMSAVNFVGFGGPHYYDKAFEDPDQDLFMEACYRFSQFQFTTEVE